MQIRPHRKIHRKKTKVIKVGNISVGGESKISVQSMTNTLTTDIKATIKQILEIQEDIDATVALTDTLKAQGLKVDEGRLEKKIGDYQTRIDEQVRNIKGNVLDYNSLIN